MELYRWRASEYGAVILHRVYMYYIVYISITYVIHTILFITLWKTVWKLILKIWHVIVAEKITERGLRFSKSHVIAVTYMAWHRPTHTVAKKKIIIFPHKAKKKKKKKQTKSKLLTKVILEMDVLSLRWRSRQSSEKVASAVFCRIPA